MNRSGRRSRALRTMNRLSASLSTAVTRGGGALDPGRRHDRVVGGVPAHAETEDLGGPVGIGLDHDHVTTGAHQVPVDAAPHPAQATEHDVAGQVIDGPLHASPPDALAESALHD